MRLAKILKHKYRLPRCAVLVAVASSEFTKVANAAVVLTYKSMRWVSKVAVKVGRRSALWPGMRRLGSVSLVMGVSPLSHC